MQNVTYMKEKYSPIVVLLFKKNFIVYNFFNYFDYFKIEFDLIKILRFFEKLIGN